MLSKVKLFNSYISTATFDEYIEQIIRLGESKKSSDVFCCNVHMITEAYKNPSINEVVNSADIVTPDGRPISVLMNYMHGLDQERACGMDLFPKIMEVSEERNLSVFFYGNTPEVLKAVESKAHKDFPGLRIAGSYSPPFRPLTLDEDQVVVNMINASGANFVFVSLGCPKQEKWMHEHKGKVKACMFGAGQAFLTYCGMEKRLPDWARNLSLEWLYRLYLEPKRLWKRYLIGNSHFLLLAGRSILLNRK